MEHNRSVTGCIRPSSVCVMPRDGNGSWFPLVDPADNEEIFTYFSDFDRTSTVATYIEVSVLIIVFLFSATGNIMVIAAVARDPRLRSVPNYLIANLSASDIMLTLTVPSLVITRVTVHWIQGRLACTMFTYMQVVSGANSMLTMMCISIDRYLAICRQGSKRLTAKNAWVVISLVWVVTSAYFVPLGLAQVVKQVAQDDQLYTFCYLQWPEGFNETYFIAGMMLLFFIVPVTVTSINYFRIWTKVRQSSLKLQSKHNDKNVKIQLRLTKMFVLVVALFVIMWLPFFTISILIVPSNLITSTIFTATTILVIGNTALNPLVYGYFNENFRRAFRALFKCEKEDIHMRPSVTVSWVK